jgi:hypothetical protein
MTNMERKDFSMLVPTFPPSTLPQKNENEDGFLVVVL